MKGKILGAAWVPGLPFVLQPNKNPQWKKLNEGLNALSTHVREMKPDVLVIYSTQWLSVLGTSFQLQENPKGIHVDENWYEWGDLPFDFKTDNSLGRLFCENVSKSGYPTKAIDYESFPIDTGTIVALNTLDPKKEFPVSVVSSWVYADAEKAMGIGRAMRETIEQSGKRAFVVVSSLLSTRFFTEDIDAEKDAVANAEDDAWNKKVLGAFESGDLATATPIIQHFAKSAPVDMLLNGYHWLTGILGDRKWSGQILAYGPQWGAGATVAEFRPKT